MKISAQEEYGLRCLLQLAERGRGFNLTIDEISFGEGLSVPYVAKLMRRLRQGGFVKSVRGQTGGYVLARPPGRIRVGEVLAALGGRLVPPDFCSRHTGDEKVCARYNGCPIRALWQGVEKAVDEVLARRTLAELAQAWPTPEPIREPRRAAARAARAARPAARTPASRRPAPAW
jgi:Rrf2 family protein